MADHLAGYVPEYIENEVEREPIVKLAKMITDRVPQKLGIKKITKYDPEYWGLAAMCTDEMAEACESRKRWIRWWSLPKWIETIWKNCWSRWL